MKTTITITPARMRVFAKSFSLYQLAERCVGKRGREVLYRLAKEASIATQDFESACTLRELQAKYKPTHS